MALYFLDSTPITIRSSTRTSKKRLDYGATIEDVSPKSKRILSQELDDSDKDVPWQGSDDLSSGDDDPIKR